MYPSDAGIREATGLSRMIVELLCMFIAEWGDEE
jgi:hypothetical protein